MINQVQQHYIRQRNDLYQTLCSHLGDHLPLIRLRRPRGGMFLWLEVPGFSSMSLFEELAAIKVITVPGTDFVVPSLALFPGEGNDLSEVRFEEPADPEALRVAFAACTSEQLQKGAMLMADTIRAMLLRQ